MGNKLEAKERQIKRKKASCCSFCACSCQINMNHYHKCKECDENDALLYAIRRAAVHLQVLHLLRQSQILTPVLCPLLVAHQSLRPLRE